MRLESCLMQIEHKTISFDLKAAGSDGSKWDGHGNVFFTIDSAQEIVCPGAFTDTLSQFLQNGFIGGLNHNWDDPIGKPTAAKEDSVGLYIEALCDVNSPEAVKCRDLIQKKIIKQLSIGYRVKGSDYLETAEDVANFWQKNGYSPTPEDIAAAQYGARLLTRLHLFEVSPVTVAANTLSYIDRVKRVSPDEIDTERKFERFLRDAGFARDAAKTICVSGFKALRQRDVEDVPTEPVIAEEPAIVEEVPPVLEAPEPEEKTEQPPIEAVVVVSTPLVQKASSAEASALYAQFLSQQAGRFASSR